MARQALQEASDASMIKSVITAKTLGKTLAPCPKFDGNPLGKPWANPWANLGQTLGKPLHF